MRTEHHTTGTSASTTLTVQGQVSADDTDRLRGAAYQALADSAEVHRRADAANTADPDGAGVGAGQRRGHAGDLVVDARTLTGFQDGAMAALSSARMRARHLGASVVVVDAADGALALSLRRTGLAFRFPRYDTVEEALASLEQARQVRSRLDTRPEDRWRTAPSVTRRPAQP